MKRRRTIKKGTRSLWVSAVIFYVLFSLLPPFAMASQRFMPIRPTASFIIPLQEEGLLDVPAIKKPWYKQWWVWAIVVGVAGGAAAALGGSSETPTSSTPPVIN